MATTTVLQDNLSQKHEELSGQLAAARTMTGKPGHSCRGCPPIDLFLAGTSRHLHAVDAVLLPAVRSHCDEGSELVHAYLHTAKELEVVLAHVKAHEFGSAWESGFDWEAVWGDVDATMSAEWDVECRMVEPLVAEMTDDQLVELSARLEQIESHAPTRPHPYLPHTGAAGRVTRGLMRVADSFWDAVEGRFVPEPERKSHKKPGLLGQYLLADPRWDVAGDPTADGPPDSETEDTAEGSWRIPH